ncbi:YoaK family protein [Brachybacterium sp. GCM10030267]|uniref:YoaK family protein n=1 Tax=Brachybacterium sp. GCM10030267 TaxID=3273381 RepID=UPI003605E0D1
MVRARPHLTLMLALTFSTGVIDAVGYLGFDRVFSGNMTGNVVLLGMGLAGANGLPIVRPALALLGFLVGAVLGGRVLGPTPKGTWTTRTTVLLVLVTAGLLGSAIIAALPGTPSHAVLGAATTTLLAVAMGMQAAAARRLAVADVTTVVVTSTIVGLAADSRLAGGTGEAWGRRILAIVLIVLGAFVGALTLYISLWLGIAVTVAVTLSVAILGHRLRESE